jgi:hypothetical protein
LAEAPEGPQTPEPAAVTHPATAGYRRRLRVIHTLIALLATAGGAVMGFIVTLALVVAQARAGTYIFGLDDLVAFRWDILPIPIFAFAGFRLARKRPHSVSWATACGFGAMVLGVITGALLGGLTREPDVGHWAGGVIGGAVGLIIGCLTSLRIKRVPRHPLIVGTAGAVVFIGMFLFAVFGATNLLDLDPLESCSIWIRWNFPRHPPSPSPLPPRWTRSSF